MGVRCPLSSLAIAAVVVVAIPDLISAQGAPDSTTVPIERLTAYARAWATISETRDDIQAQLAMAKNKTAEAQQALRDTLRVRVARIVTEHGMTEVEYRRITFRVSTDAELRKRFEEIVAALPKKEGGDG